MNRKIYLSLGLPSASLIAFQLSLMQLISAVQWNHFAYMVISIALLGFGASGTLLSLTRKWLERHTEFALYLLMILTGVSMSAIILFSSALFGRFDTYLIFVDLSNAKYLFLSYFSFFVPFFFGALAIGLIYIRYVNRIGTMYFADLLGSGLGGVFLLGLLWLFYPAQLPAAVSILPIVAGILILPKSWFRRLIFPSLLLLFLPVYLIAFPSELPVSEFKSISRVLNMPGSDIYMERKSPYGHIQIIESPSLRYAPGLSLSFTEDIPVGDVLFSNGNWFGALTNRDKDDKIHFLNYTTHNLPYVISKPANVLILGGGTGLHAGHALWNGASKVTVVEENKKSYQAVSRIKGTKPSFGFVPSLKLSVKSFDGIIVDQIIKALYLDDIGIRKEPTSRFSISIVAIHNNSFSGLAELFLAAREQSMSSGRISEFGDMEIQDDSCFKV